MTKIILHNGRCGSTYMYLVIDRYYRAKYGDNSMGDHTSIYERLYDFNVDKYAGLNEYLVPEVTNTVFYNDTMWVWSPVRSGGRKKIRGKNVSEVLYHTQTTNDSSEKINRRKIITDLIKNIDVVLKYPLLTNPKPTWDVDYISCERKDIEKQTRSIYLSVTTGYYHFSEGQEKIRDRLKKFKPNQEVLNNLTKKTKESWNLYRSIKPKRCQTFFMEDFENLKPFEVLEMIGITDWGKYLDKNFDVPIRKAWHSEDTAITKCS